MSGAARPPRSRVNDPQGLRGRVLDQAAAAFQSRGYQATTLQEVGRAAGVTGGALAHHFPTKRALGLAVIRERVAAIVTATWIEPVAAARTARGGVLAVLRRIAAELDARGQVEGCPLGNLALEVSLADAEMRAAIGELFARWEATLAGKFRADAGLGEAEAAALASFVVAAYSGAMALAKVGQSSAPLRTCARSLSGVMPPLPGVGRA